MAYKTRLSWLGWALMAPLATVNLGSFGLVVLRAWPDLWKGATAASSLGPEHGWLAELFSIVVLLNLALLPFVLLNVRLKRSSDYY